MTPRSFVGMAAIGVAFSVLVGCGGSSFVGDGGQGGAAGEGDEGGAGGEGGDVGEGGDGAGGSGGPGGSSSGGEGGFGGGCSPVGPIGSGGCNSCHCTESGEIVCTDVACPDCEHNGEFYFEGESFPAGDGCNTCSCGADGMVACTLRACVVCEHAGNTYEPGDMFPAGDGCNTCSCTEFGEVACTDVACACNRELDWFRDYAGTPDSCESIDFGCPANTEMFENECGCGCEQNRECPRFLNCQPPNVCDPEAFEKQCPYSGIAL